jgi:hypothetical protein
MTNKQKNIFKSLARSNVFSSKSDYIFHVFSEARDHILILNILFFNKLRQIIPEIRSERRDLLIRHYKWL